MRLRERTTSLLPAVLLLAVLLPAGCNKATDAGPAEIIAAQYLSLIQAQQSAAAYALLTPVCRQYRTQREMQGVWTLQESRKGSLRTWNVTGYYTSTLKGSPLIHLDYRLNFERGNTNISFQMLPVNGQWRINDYQMAS